MRIITLGTGAGRPTLRRASSAAGLEFLGNTFLFDCGEGTQLQLMKSSFKWGKVAAIFISHLHGDHVNGLPGLLGTLSLSDRQEKLRVFGPKGLKSFLKVFQKHQHMNLRYPLEVVEIRTPGILWETDTYRIETHPLEHTVKCWGYVFREKDLPGHFDEEKAEQIGIPSGPLRGRLVKGEAITMEDGRTFHPQDFLGPTRPGRAVAYCLDTRPCPTARRLAQGVDLLLYEATFVQDHQQDAHEWGHSTAADGARLAREAEVRNLVLTHISQRYQNDDVLWEEAQAIFPNAAIANDLDVFEVKRG